MHIVRWDGRSDAIDICGGQHSPLTQPVPKFDGSVETLRHGATADNTDEGPVFEEGWWFGSNEREKNPYMSKARAHFVKDEVLGAKACSYSHAHL